MRKPVVTALTVVLLLGGATDATAQTVGGEPGAGGLFYYPGPDELPYDGVNTAEDDLDRQNKANEVVSVDTNPPTINGDLAVGIVKRRVGGGITVPMLDNQVEIKYLYIGRTCAGGTRIELAISTDGDKVPEGNAFGYLGDKAFGGDCPQRKWVFEDMTNGAPKWDLSQFGGNPSNSWNEMEQFFGTTGHRVKSISLTDDSASFAPSAIGCAYYDVFGAGARHLTDHDDTLGESGGGPNGC